MEKLKTEESPKLNPQKPIGGTEMKPRNELILHEAIEHEHCNANSDQPSVYAPRLSCHRALPKATTPT
jgi:hypothetical protein